jgi:CheY-like chemotaxis protein
VVDDDPAMRDAMVEACTSTGLRVVAVVDGREALNALEQGAVDPCLIILDLRMPTMDGWEFREHQLRDRRLAAIPVVVVSSYADPRREATSMGALAGMRKPIEIDEVLRLLAVTCRR